MTHPFGLLRQRNIILQYYVEHSMFIIGQIKCSWLLPHRQAICFSSLIWLSRNKSVKKSRFSRIVKNSREFSLLDLKAFWFHFSLLEKEWKHFIFTLHFSKKSESFLFSLFTSRTSKTHSRWSLPRQYEQLRTSIGAKKQHFGANKLHSGLIRAINSMMNLTAFCFFFTPALANLNQAKILANLFRTWKERKN